MINRPRNRRRGWTLVESALIFSTFLFMIIGVLDFGQFLYLHQAITERARAAARFGALQPFNSNTTPTQIQNMVIYNSPIAPLVPTGDPTFGLTPAMVTVTAIGHLIMISGCLSPAIRIRYSRHISAGRIMGLTLSQAPRAKMSVDPYVRSTGAFTSPACK